MKINAKNGFDIRFIKNNTYALLVTFNDIEEDLRSAFFTVKENPEDEIPILQKSLGAGISKVDDRAYKNEKKYKLQLQAEDTTPLEADVQYLYDFQVTIGNVVKTIASGLFVVSPTITGDKVITTQEIVAEVTDELETEFATVEATAGVEYEQDPVARAIIGDMTALNTMANETVVQAINELVKDERNIATDVANIASGALPVGSARYANVARSAGNATTANSAKIATYASEDTSKGTIEERLTAMGFKSGVAVLSDGVTAYTNSLIKQGKYVIFNLNVTGGYCTSIGIPEEFRPKSKISIVGSTTAYLSFTEFKYTCLAVSAAFNPSTGCFENFVAHSLSGEFVENLHVDQIVNAGWECE